MNEKGAIILVVDDEKPIRRFLKAALSAHQYTIYEAEDGQSALMQAANLRPDLIILDLGLPDMDGSEVTRRLREWTQTPIIILSVRDQEKDKINALDAGADDYLTKPFGVGELSARIRVALRHAFQVESKPVYHVGALHIDLTRRAVSVGEREVSLTPNEYEILKLLVTHAGKVITHRQILHQVWGAEFQNEAHLLRVNISNLRHKIEPDPAQPIFILTESGIGYRLKAED